MQESKKSHEDRIRRISCSIQQKLDFIFEEFNNEDNTALRIKIAKL